MPIIHIREDANEEPKSKLKVGTKSKPAKKRAGKAEIPSDKKLDEKVDENPTTGDK